MSNLLYLGVAVVLSIAGWVVLWLRHRQPRGTDASIREFSRELKALAPPDEGGRSRDTERWGRRSG